MFGKSGVNSPTYVNNDLLFTYATQKLAASSLKIPEYTISRYIKSGKLWENQYFFRRSPSTPQE
ncbi:hypothetical protein BC937DRAFT_88890 [Endogone sp. FLAS-F59071]|nr:hypothetical protein BC937DRAFT_88890 [Endogone sp. FLAS-F59071]|eukprot:RUS23423.1 hypothetical protein BC937DRAFT_88890 [Endogone sp. FLAS-F59071]